MAGLLVDTEITEQTIPPAAWARLCHLYRLAHSNMHRGRYMDLFTFYADGLADGLEISSRDLQAYVADAVTEQRSYVV
jgi:hypothetical protein